MRLVLVFVWAFLLNVATSKQINGQSERDLTQYDKGGTFELRIFRDEPNSYGAKEGQFREFLWVHWRRHRLGYVVVKRHPIDQPANTTFYFVEPDVDGIWRVVMRMERVDPDRAKPKQRHLVVEEVSIYEIQRAEFKKDSQDNWILIPQEKDRAQGGYVLLIRDKGGKLLGYQ